MAGRSCKICASAASIKIAAEMIAAGATDGAIAAQLGNVSRVSVHRHRVNHVERPAQALVEASNKGMAVRAERETLLAGAEAGDAVKSFIGLTAIVSTLKGVGDRLERVADAAEASGQRAIIAPLAAQQLKAAETRARMGGLDGFVPTKAAVAVVPVFNLEIKFSDHTESITAVRGGAAPVIDGAALPVPLPEDGPDDEYVLDMEADDDV